MTTNKPFAEWGAVFPNAACVTVMVDRLIHRSELVVIDGNSLPRPRSRGTEEEAARTAPQEEERERIMNPASRFVPVDPERIRRIPSTGFGWIDRRFFRDGYAAELSHYGILLYAFLCSVANATGHSWYGEPKIAHLLRLSPAQLKRARHELPKRTTRGLR